MDAFPHFPLSKHSKQYLQAFKSLGPRGLRFGVNPRDPNSPLQVIFSDFRARL